MSSSPLAQFLVASRARVRPQDAGVPDDGRQRRVPGLRREEVAKLANLSSDYLARLEQGRLTSASPAILDALADALGLDQAGRDYLHSLSGPGRRAPARTETVDAATYRLLDSLVEIPALVFGPRLDILAWNRLAAALFVDYSTVPDEDRNLIRLSFLDPGYRRLYADWSQAARECVAYLRMEARNFPDDERLARLVRELASQDRDFRTWWDSHQVAGSTVRSKTYRHPKVGLLTLDAQQFDVAGRSDQHLVVYTAEPGSPSQEALHLLASAA